MNMRVNGEGTVRTALQPLIGGPAGLPSAADLVAPEATAAALQRLIRPAVHQPTPTTEAAPSGTETAQQRLSLSEAMMEMVRDMREARQSDMQEARIAAGQHHLVEASDKADEAQALNPGGQVADAMKARADEASRKGRGGPPAGEGGGQAAEEGERAPRRKFGSRIKEAFKEVGQKVLGVVGKVLDVAKKVIDTVAGFLPPPASTALVALGAGIATVNNMAVKTGAAMLNGVPPREAFKQAAKEQAMDLAESAISAVPGGGVVKAGMAVAKGVGKEIGKEVAEQGTKAVVNHGVRAVAREGAEEVVEKAAVGVTRTALRDVAKDTAVDMGTDVVINAAMTRMLQMRNERQQRAAETQARQQVNLDVVAAVLAAEQKAAQELNGVIDAIPMVGAAPANRA
jgi:hypothetical protein